MLNPHDGTGKVASIRTMKVDRIANECDHGSDLALSSADRFINRAFTITLHDVVRSHPLGP